MRKLQKVIICCLLTMALVLTNFSPPVYAQELSLDNQLREKGVPDFLINMMPTEQKLDIVNSNVIFDSYKTFTLDEESNNLTRGTIPSGDLTFTCSIYKSYPWNSTSKGMIVTINYDWINQPYFNLTDCFGLCWDNTLWQAIPGSEYISTSWLLDDWKTVKTETDNVLAYAATNGAGWNTDIKEIYGSKYVVDNYGYAKISLRAKNPSKTGNDQLILNYSHAVGLGTIGLAFGPFNVTYSGNASAHTRGAYLDFTY